MQSSPDSCVSTPLSYLRLNQPQRVLLKQLIELIEAALTDQTLYDAQRRKLNDSALRAQLTITLPQDLPQIDDSVQTALQMTYEMAGWRWCRLDRTPGGVLLRLGLPYG